MARERCESLLARGLDEGRLQLVGDHVYAAASVRSALHAVWRNAAARDGVLEIPALRDELDTSRKWLIPLLEYIDATGLTRLRAGERRLLASSDIARELAAESSAEGVERPDPS
ncbi:MAG: SelB C-terminal domain-containing protein [Planctomycetes bacterium]|nr:SelB C-terminal domain-containing protein [Planctomycetota bacterium]